MKKNKTSDFFGSKGFYIALFSAVLLVAAIAAIVSVTNMNTANLAENELSKANQSYAIDTTLGDSTASTPKSTVPFNSSGGGIDKDTRMAGVSNPTTGIGSNTAANSNAATGSTGSQYYANNSGSSYAANSQNPIVSSKPIIEVTDEEVVETSASTTKPLTETTDTAEAAVIPEATASEQPPVQTSAEAESDATPAATTAEATAPAEETPESSETFLSFSESSKMIWPVAGEIAMSYSMDHVIYDKTLDQYRTNNGVSIAAPAGSQVKSAASGVVDSVEHNDQSGNTVVIDHGNGWKTTYGQLQNNVLVDVGQTVKEGQVIGGVETPTRYGILLGDHLEFKVTKNDIPQDPSTVLGEDK